MIEPPQGYHSTLYTLTIFDIRLPDGRRRFSQERAAWGEYADVEMLDLNHPVLIGRPGAGLALLDKE